MGEGKGRKEKGVHCGSRWEVGDELRKKGKTKDTSQKVVLTCSPARHIVVYDPQNEFVTFGGRHGPDEWDSK